MRQFSRQQQINQMVRRRFNVNNGNEPQEEMKIDQIV